MQRFAFVLSLASFAGPFPSHSKIGVDQGLAHNIRNRRLEEILLEEPYRTIHPQAWAENTNPVCIRKCAKMQRSSRRGL